MQTTTEKKIKSLDLEPMNATYSYLIVNGEIAGRFTHAQAEQVRSQWIDELAASHEDR